MIADRGTRITDRKERSWRVAETATSAEDFRRRTFEFGIRVIRLVEWALSKKSAMSHFTGLKCLLISD